MKKTKTIFLICFVFFLSNGCNKTEDFVYLPLELTASVNDVSEFGLKDGSIDLTVLNGEPPYSFMWSNSSTNEDLINLDCGEYSVVVSDIRNETIKDTFRIVQP
ncbi:MAG: SprB repeat-containing protein, partial [Draconibacterium sp.]|nr:SprB repeat-containing protein [Draconibacterium sp.]